MIEIVETITNLCNYDKYEFILKDIFKIHNNKNIAIFNMIIFFQ